MKKLALVLQGMVGSVFSLTLLAIFLYPDVRINLVGCHKVLVPSKYFKRCATSGASRKKARLSAVSSSKVVLDQSIFNA